MSTIEDVQGVLCAPLGSQLAKPSAVSSPPAVESSLSRWIPVTVALQKTGGSRTLAVLDLGLILELEKHSVRAGGHRVLVQGEDGKLVPQATSPVRTVRGKILGLAGSIVRGSIQDDRLHARLLTRRFGEFWLQPAQGRGPVLRPGRHILHRSADVIRGRGTCGSDKLPLMRKTPFLGPRPGLQGGVGGGRRGPDPDLVAEPRHLRQQLARASKRPTKKTRRIPDRPAEPAALLT